MTILPLLLIRCLSVAFDVAAGVVGVGRVERGYKGFLRVPFVSRSSFIWFG